MYIKAGQKPRQSEKKDERSGRSKNKHLPELETDFKDRVVSSNLYKKEPNRNTEETLNSLKFLHKPQRVTQMRANRFPEEEVQRNTDLNKRISLQGIMKTSKTGATGSEVALPIIAPEESR